MDRGRSRAVDALKLVLALMVVGIHANPFADIGAEPVQRLVNLLTGEGLFRLGVPVFLVFNGYFLQGAIARGAGWGVVRRIAQLYLVWMLLYLPVYWPLLAGLDPRRKVLLLTLGYWHLWYLAGLAIAAGVLVALRTMSDAALLALVAASWFGGVAVTWLRALGLIEIPWVFADPLSPNRNALFLCLPYAGFGLWMARRRLPDRVSAARAGALAAAGTLAVMAESLLLSQMPQGVSHDTLATLGLAAPALALWALTRPGRSDSRATGDLANGLYFLHVAFVALLFRHTDLPAPPIWLFAVLGAAGLTLLLRRTGLARHLF